MRVFRAPGCPNRGRLRVGPLDIPCALGRSGPVPRKREGDGGTPTGRMRVLGAYYRADRISRPSTLLQLRPIGPAHGWCDDPASSLYNRPVRLPSGPSHERLWREDDLYDVILDLGWNRHPAIRRRGSAVFLHVARSGFLPTEGCVAVERRLVNRILSRIGPRTVVDILAKPRRSRHQRLRP
ncbi:L,D-transpeptidase [uncultured Enterovirga sp.]|uniref:L,D-transpeptidase family protein n=1 Tax=uncultured Enterovirga sp. TaxID=2026352 RepID=UPI0035CA7DE1